MYPNCSISLGSFTNSHSYSYNNETLCSPLPFNSGSSDSSYFDVSNSSNSSSSGFSSCSSFSSSLSSSNSSRSNSPTSSVDSYYEHSSCSIRDSDISNLSENLFEISKSTDQNENFCALGALSKCHKLVPKVLGLPQIDLENNLDSTSVDHDTTPQRMSENSAKSPGHTDLLLKLATKFSRHTIVCKKISNAVSRIKHTWHSAYRYSSITENHYRSRFLPWLKFFIVLRNKFIHACRSKRNIQEFLIRKSSWMNKKYFSNLLFIIGITVTLISFAGRTYHRNKDWFSDEALYTSGINISPSKG